MREFSSGATRNDIEGKLSYMRALSPAVLRRYVAYLAKHRQTPNGLRAFDNWKKGIDQNTYCDSLLRHVWDAWLMETGSESSDVNYTLEDLLCAIIFNAQGWLFELIHNETREQVPITDPARLSPVAKTCRECDKYWSKPLCMDGARKAGACFISEVPVVKTCSNCNYCGIPVPCAGHSALDPACEHYVSMVPE